MTVALGQSMPTVAHPTVSRDVKAKLKRWSANKTREAPQPIAELEFTNVSKKTCIVKRYSLHWSTGSFDETPKELRLAPGQTVTHQINFFMLGYDVPIVGFKAPTGDDAIALVQVWKADCS